MCVKKNQYTKERLQEIELEANKPQAKENTLVTTAPVIPLVPDMSWLKEDVLVDWMGMDPKKAKKVEKIIKAILFLAAFALLCAFPAPPPY